MEAILQRAADTFAEYRTTSYAERARHLINAADLFEGEAPDIARIVTTEMGKTFASARGEASKCALGLRWFAEHAESLLADEPIATGASRSYVHYQPIGVVLAIMPWNFPLWQVVRFAAPALMVGNVGLLKHASNVPQTALLLEDIFRRAGLPEGAFSNLFVESKDVAAIIEDPRIAAVTLTGSERAGMSVAATAGHALKKSVLELGGSDPFIVLPSADLDATVRTAVNARVQNNGQSCIAAKRFIVVEPVADEFLRRFTEAMDALVVGDPFDPATQVGPIVTEAQREELLGPDRGGPQPGGGRSTAARRSTGPGWYLKPAVLSGVTADMPVAQEELFGPVAIVERVPDLDRGPRGGELDHVRARLERVDERRGGAAALYRGDRGRRGVRQRHGGLDARAALRGDQAVGLRTGALRAGPEGVHQRQDRLDHMSRPASHEPRIT